MDWLNNDQGSDGRLQVERMLLSGNPYQNMVSYNFKPKEEILLNASSILGVFPELKQKSFTAEIALDEYKHYIDQTYYFEALGFQILGHMSQYADSLSFLHEVAAQSLDEARHMEIYGWIRKQIGSVSSPRPQLNHIFRKITESDSIAEKSIKAFLLLESLAAGLFSARSHVYMNEPIATIDRHVLREETLHQSHAIDIIEGFIAEGVIKRSEIREIVREGLKELQLDAMPQEVLSKHGLDYDTSIKNQLLQHGILKNQKKFSQKNILMNLKRLGV